MDLPPSDADEPTPAHEIGSRTYAIAEVKPLDVTGIRTVGVGTALFLVTFVALLPFYGALQDAGRGWWLWTCAAGFGLGMFGFDFCRRRTRPMPPEGSDAAQSTAARSSRRSSGRRNKAT